MEKKAIISALVLAVIISCVSLVVAPIKQTVLGQQTTTATNFLPYENSTYGIKVQYPSTGINKKTAQDRTQKLILLHFILRLQTPMLVLIYQ